MDFGELKNDTDFINKINNLDKSLDQVREQLNKAYEIDYENLSSEDKVKLDLFISYSINSLYFMYLKLNGTDTSEHGIKNELSRIRQAILRDKQIYDRKTIRPKLNVPAAGRFIRHGLWDLNDKNKESNQKSRKRKLDQDDE